MDSLKLLDFSSFIIFSDDPWSLLVSFRQLFKLPLVVQCCDVICEWPLIKDLWSSLSVLWYLRTSVPIYHLPFLNSQCETMQRFIASSNAAGGRCAGAGWGVSFNGHMMSWALGAGEDATHSGKVGPQHWQHSHPWDNPLHGAAEKLNGGLI